MGELIYDLNNIQNTIDGIYNAMVEFDYSNAQRKEMRNVINILEDTIREWEELRNEEWGE